MARTSGTQKMLGITLLILVMGIVIFGIVRLFPTASNQGYAPEQPIPFSHKKHAGTYKIPCLYCHSEAEKSRHASIPGLGICMNCHRVVKPESPYIQKMKKAFDQGKPIEWIRIHENPDHVEFNHKRHIAMGVSCEVCHGRVQDMERVEQKMALTMGMCIECHRGETAPRSLLQKVYPHTKTPKGAVAPTQCSTCHK